MNRWFMRSLGDGVLAGEHIDSIKAIFVPAYTEAGCPRDMALFSRHESDGRLHCEVQVFFSPSSAHVAKEIGATACERPEPGNLDLLAGSENSWQVLFPERMK